MIGQRERVASWDSDLSAITQWKHRFVAKGKGKRIGKLDRKQRQTTKNTNNLLFTDNEQPSTHLLPVIVSGLHIVYKHCLYCVQNHVNLQCDNNCHDALREKLNCSNSRGCMYSKTAVTRRNLVAHSCLSVCAHFLPVYGNM